MTDPDNHPDDPVAAFKQRNKGKTLTFNFEAGPVETLDGVPLRVADAVTVTFKVDDDGVLIPEWPESDD